MWSNVKLAIPVIALAAMFMIVAPPQAQAGVHFGIYLGAPPVYVTPAYPYAYGYPYTYPAPYAYPYAYGYSYGYPGIYYGGHYGSYGHDRGDHYRGGHAYRGGHESHDSGHRR